MSALDSSGVSRVSHQGGRSDTPVPSIQGPSFLPLGRHQTAPNLTVQAAETPAVTANTWPRQPAQNLANRPWAAIPGGMELKTWASPQEEALDALLGLPLDEADLLWTEYNDEEVRQLVEALQFAADRASFDFNALMPEIEQTPRRFIGSCAKFLRRCRRRWDDARGGGAAGRG